MFKENYFEKFSLPIQFEVDLEELEEKYLKFQREFHPDAISYKSDKEQLVAIQNSSFINQAYNILKNPIKRAIYLLSLKGIKIDDDHNSIKPDNQTLILIMKIREEIEEAKNIDEIKNIKKLIKKDIASCLEKVKDLLNKEDYKKGGKEAIKLQYLNKILIDLKKNKKFD